ncbi:O-fucosyltransferase 31-like [Aristolochia californica]|uniref:O-fucosyltransferase 31-like n=1 Tax=Aristolochia californica TaxID=171875 RepID=UPI0035DFCFE1
MGTCFYSLKICDAVAIAKILNATLVIQHFEVNPVWQDSSSFTDIFDVDHFIDVLKDEVYGIVAIAPFSHRLAFDSLPLDIQRLRCKVNFQALTFVPHINDLGDALFKRLRNSPGLTQNLANGWGKAEKLALAKYRQVIWQGRVLNSQFTDDELTNQGRCPLTPEEIGLRLAALGFDNITRLYLVSHNVLTSLPPPDYHHQHFSLHL